MRALRRHWRWVTPLALALTALLVVLVSRPSPLPAEECASQVSDLVSWMRLAHREGDGKFLAGDGEKIVGVAINRRAAYPSYRRRSSDYFTILAAEGERSYDGDVYPASQEERCENIRSNAEHFAKYGYDSPLLLYLGLEWNVPWSRVAAVLSCAEDYNGVLIFFERRATMMAPPPSSLSPYIDEHWFHWDSSRTTDEARTRTLFERAMVGCDQSSLVAQAGTLASMPLTERSALFISALEQDLRRCSCTAHFDELRSLAWYFIGPFFQTHAFYWNPPVQVAALVDSDAVRVAFPAQAPVHTIAEALVAQTQAAHGRPIQFEVEEEVHPAAKQ